MKKFAGSRLPYLNAIFIIGTDEMIVVREGDGEEGLGTLGELVQTLPCRHVGYLDVGGCMHVHDTQLAIRRQRILVVTGENTALHRQFLRADALFCCEVPEGGNISIINSLVERNERFAIRKEDRWELIIGFVRADAIEFLTSASVPETYGAVAFGDDRFAVR